MPTRSRQLLASGAAGIVLLAGGWFLTPTAAAAPPIPPATPLIPPHCEMIDRVLFCDGPIGANQSWERCEMREGRVMVLFPGSYIPALQKCGQVTQDTVPAGSPPHHIG